MHVLVVCLNPTVQRTLVVEGLRIGEVNRVVEHRIDASGKGVNAGRVLAQLGARVTHLTQSGGRDHELFRRLAEEDGIEMATVEADVELRQGTTVIDRSTATTTEVVEKRETVPSGTEDRIRRRYEELLPPADGVLIAGSKAPGFSGELFPGLVERARAAGKFVLIDYRGEDLLGSLPHRPDIVKPNLMEFARTFLSEQAGADLSEHEHDEELLAETRRKMLELHASYGADVVLTRGSSPALYVVDGVVEEAAPPEITPVNTIGSGDAFGGALVFKRLSGATLAESVRFAHACAAENAKLLKPGSIR